MSKKVYIKPEPIKFRFKEMMNKRLKINGPVNVIVKRKPAENYWLSYPRSGMHMAKNVLNHLGIQVHTGHEINLWEKQFPIRGNDVFFLLLRDYAECIPREVYTDQNVTDKMVAELFTNKTNRIQNAWKYIENIVIYDMMPGNKFLLRYEDIKLYEKVPFKNIAGHFGKEKELEELDWSATMAESLEKYNTAMSDGTVHFHKKRVKNLGYFRQMMYKLNPYIYEKYLECYDVL
jgi:hypothetical protein